jgi:hypothetical protein
LYNIKIKGIPSKDISPAANIKNVEVVDLVENSSGNPKTTTKKENKRIKIAEDGDTPFEVKLKAEPQLGQNLASLSVKRGVPQ